MSNDKTELKKGDSVVMHSCIEASGNNKGKIWICKTDQFIDKSKNNVVFLEGFSGSFVVEYLERIDLSGYYNDSPTPLSAETVFNEDGSFVVGKELTWQMNKREVTIFWKHKNCTGDYLEGLIKGSMWGQEQAEKQTAALQSQVNGLMKDCLRSVEMRKETLEENAKLFLELESLKQRNDMLEKLMPDLLHNFWQSKSDACPFEASISEQQEIDFKNYVLTELQVLNLTDDKNKGV